MIVLVVSLIVQWNLSIRSPVYGGHLLYSGKYVWPLVPNQPCILCVHFMFYITAMRIPAT